MQDPGEQPAVLPQAAGGAEPGAGCLLRGRQRHLGSVPERGPVSTVSPGGQMLAAEFCDLNWS